MTIVLNVGIVLIRSDTKVTTYSNKCRSRIISTSLLAHDENEELSGVYSGQTEAMWIE